MMPLGRIIMHNLDSATRLVALDGCESTHGTESHDVHVCCCEAPDPSNGHDGGGRPRSSGSSRARSSRPPVSDLKLRSLDTSALVSYVIVVHHDFLRTSLPFIKNVGHEVARIHGPNEPRLVPLAALVTTFADTLLAHIDDEEEWFYGSALGATPDPSCVSTAWGSLANDHRTIDQLLRQIRTVSDDYRCPEGACASYSEFFAAMRHMDRDFIRHDHIEHKILMPRFKLDAPLEHA
jgi:regulator of cell morphogenesis and NO signaling